MAQQHAAAARHKDLLKPGFKGMGRDEISRPDGNDMETDASTTGQGQEQGIQNENPLKEQKVFS